MELYFLKMTILLTRMLRMRGRLCKRGDSNLKHEEAFDNDKEKGKKETT